jgi:transcriptional regulator with XRE-family HTH domain
MSTRTHSLIKLEARRKELGMTVEFVARRSGVSRSTVERILSGSYGAASFDTVQAIAEVVGAVVVVQDAADPDDMLQRQAELKAAEIVRLVQGTSALEGQGVDEATYRSLLRQTVHRLLAGSRRALWAS